MFSDYKGIAVQTALVPLGVWHKSCSSHKTKAMNSKTHIILRATYSSTEGEGLECSE